MLPLRKNLERLFKETVIINQILEFKNYLKCSQRIENVTQAKLWEQIEEKYPDSPEELKIPLIDYFDDYQPLNALGRHSSAYSIGAAYVSLGCLPPQLASKTSLIFTSVLFFSDDRKCFGNKLIFAPHINALNDLVKNGIKVNHPKIKRIKFFLIAFTGDNKSTREAFGFQVHFHSGSPCILCRAEIDLIRSMVTEDLSILRTIENYKSDLVNCACGVREPSPYSCIENFEITKNLPPDAMHDILEGTAHYDFCYSFKNIISTKKYITLKDFNNRLRGFDFGPFVSNRPDVISQTNLLSGKLPFTSAETLNFIQNFPFIYGDVIPEDDDYWNVLILLRKISKIIFAESFIQGEEIVLIELLKEHHESFIKLFGPVLKPKHHFLLHYGRLMLLFGPLKHLWTMRKESRHKSKFRFLKLSNAFNCLNYINFSFKRH